MTEIRFTFDVAVAPAAVQRALTTPSGIAGFWTDQAEMAGEDHDLLVVRFADAPLPFDLQVEQRGGELIWRAQSFPPHWVGTEIGWQVAANDDGSTVDFRHSGLDDPQESGRIAYVWGQVMVSLTDYLATGQPDPHFRS